MITDIKSHLIERGVNLEKTNVLLDEENVYCTFLLYNLSGKLVGYQHYNPNADKTFNQGCSEGKRKTREEMVQMMRYYTWTTKIGKINELAVLGFRNSKF